jgi:hypothetical protein
MTSSPIKSENLSLSELQSEILEIERRERMIEAELLKMMDVLAVNEGIINSEEIEIETFCGRKRKTCIISKTTAKRQKL